ncbi:MULTISPECIES: hypothetical protein [Metabacillus]|jgi:hypothetical protein|uniref:IDEAL domain-containing protein n=1 Tax=Metabacillus rhizolycopersici TaxID=2875709 RepID=A0ABS7UMH5_9BACI|nr:MULTISPECIES: hypothetical protein [Metabacillus]MBZ5749513.1 hypothetical protein [Metabacillus rhizolycopersici]MCM3653288.1 hypothetical protein [Metabacillus litoralis]
MFRHFIALKTFVHQIDCFCPDGEHADYITINKGDVIEVTKERNFTEGSGWYFLIGINDQCFFYIAIEEMEQYVAKERVISIVDINLKMNYLQFKINQSLDSLDEASFVNYTNQLNEVSDLKETLDQYLYTVSV